MAKRSSREKLSELIGEIYDCVLEPGNWEATLRSINDEFFFVSSALTVTPLRQGVPAINASAGVDPEWLEIGRTDKYTADAVDIWGGLDRIQQFPLDEPIVHSHALGYEKRFGNRYFHEVLDPRGITDSVVIILAREPLLLGTVGFNLHASRAAIGGTEIDALRILGPHFRRAVTISNLFDMQAIETKTIASVLDALSAGVILVDDALGIVHANAAGEAMLAARGPVQSERGIFALRSKPASDALKAAVAQAANDEAAMGQRGIGIPAGETDGEAKVIHVLPLRRSERRRGLVQRAVAALFIAPIGSPPRFPGDALALVYDLTPAEARIFELVCGGATPRKIAAELGVAPTTVRTHLQHVFQKTGCKRQVDLVKLAAGVSPPA